MKGETETDRFFMKRAILLASRARGKTSPNPMVGAVLVKKNKVIAEDYHRMAGTPHAEALVIRKAGRNARSSTLYVSLEPCCHTDKRTPPCARAIIESGIKTVVIAMHDPNPKVSGKGIRELEQAGVAVKSGILEEKAQRLNESYVKFVTTKRPFVTLKVAMTLDGKIATPEGQSKWITGEKARAMVHRLRSSVDAILTAIGTVRSDDPLLTARIKGAGSPHRIIIDPDLEIPAGAKILTPPPETTIVMRSPTDYHRHSDLEKKKMALAKKGITFIEYEGEMLDLAWLMDRLGEMGISSLIVEGGSSLNARALQDGIVDKVLFFIAPKIIGGKESFPAVGGRTFRRLEDAISLRDVRVKKLGADILVEGYL
ncbi:MAG TPA: bifunctional diaminohydroxyphosphoribosylaminopyrimidine deaminase/5-amino-6-(5-phosphoribosylamino)uracil reductase RibD [Thermodesulfovibrionales bacterium]|nr:bifunctional diaminohydroxyphosphoribosylaminopyrimidine deaminase/5-amino-6-(5-phosphoribosylamino)uracil reductase RibD [Thermodesulfovibrionales bacterium]